MAGWSCSLARVALFGTALGLLSGCVGGPDGVRGTRGAPQADLGAPVADPGAPGQAGRIGTGSVKVALLIPLSGQGANLGAAMRNAAELALAEFQQPDLQIIVKDDRGAPDGAREGAQAALADGAELVMGPLFAANVAAAAGPARAAGRPVIAYSSDATVASQGVYLLSFLPQAEVERVVDEAVSGGKRSFAALIPENAYGNAVEASFRETVARRGARIAAVERYAPGQPGPAVERLAGVITGPGAQADALFIPESPDGLAAVAAALTRAGFSPARVRPIGTALWNDPRVFALPALQGGRFAAADPAGFAAFAGRYQARYGASPPRVASLAYDSVSLAAALTRQYGSQRFAEATLTGAAGFSGVDGTFRFRPEGVSERALAVYEIRSNAAAIVSPAPRALGKPGT
ncbi:penicillin-binding protein activator [Methylobacterium sp. A54F]